MVFQCGAVIISLMALGFASQTPSWMNWLLTIVVWLAVGSTIYSGAAYIWQAIRIMMRPAD